MKIIMRKGIGILVCMLMLVGMFSTSVAAENSTTAKITIEKEGSTFTAYKILDLKVQEGNSSYEVAVAGAFQSFLNNGEYGSYTLNQIETIASNSEEAEKFAIHVKNYIKDNNVLSDAQINHNTPQEVELGYYLILETATDTTKPTVASKPILVSVPQSTQNAEGQFEWNYNVTIKVKDSQADINKEIIVNDTGVNASIEQINSTIVYRITAGVPKYSADATNIKYVMKDTLDKGLTFTEGTVKVYSLADDVKTLVENAVTIDKVVNADGTTTLTLSFDYNQIKAMDEICVEYEAILNENAIIGSVGNKNKVNLTYTNNPDQNDDYTTPDKEVVTYTYGLQIEKTDGESKKVLEGAIFTIENADKSYSKTVTTDVYGIIHLSGLNEGTYTVKETKAPSGYILPNGEITVEIIANRGDDGSIAQGYQVKVDSGQATEASTIVTKDGLNHIYGNLGITNQKGFNLPQTGGAGTWMFTVGGLFIIAVAMVIFIKSRRSTRED